MLQNYQPQERVPSLLQEPDISPLVDEREMFGTLTSQAALVAVLSPNLAKPSISQIYFSSPVIEFLQYILHQKAGTYPVS